MKIAVLNGSPKGPVSVTMQYVSYITKRHPEHELKVFHVAQKVHVLEKEPGRFEAIIEEIRRSDGVLWAFPLYILLVSSQYKRFIELIGERKAGGAFAGRYAAALSTSINFYDNTAHAYIRGISEDLGLKYLGFYSASMHDLMKKTEQERLELFARSFFQGIQVSALDVFHQCQFEHLLGSGLLDNDRHPGQPGHLCCLQTPLAGNELVTLWPLLGHDQGLDQPMFADRGRQICQGIGIKDSTGLHRIGCNRRHWDLGHAPFWRFRHRDQRLQPLT